MFLFSTIDIYPHVYLIDYRKLVTTKTCYKAIKADTVGVHNKANTGELASDSVTVLGRS